MKTEKEKEKEKEKGIKKMRILILHAWLWGYDNAAPLRFGYAGRQAGRGGRQASVVVGGDGRWVGAV